MSGRSIFNKNNKPSVLSRRSFLQKGAILSLAAAASPVLTYCSGNNSSAENIKGKILGGNASVGHLLRKNIANQIPAETIQIDIVIVGGGVSGLSAGRFLKKAGKENFLLLELDEQVGGNSASGKNNVSAYPWGAHYLPLPNRSDKDLIDFLEEKKVITGYDEHGKPVFNDYYLCFAPHERLFIHGHWQEGLVPHFGVPEKDMKEIQRFMSLMSEFRNAKGSDGKEAFFIPVDFSSRDEKFTLLDKQTMKEYMVANEFNSPYLQWYVDYSCRDDYGTALEETSAWAGIHYFAARKGEAANADPATVLTWPEGNGWLVSQLKDSFQDKILSNALAISVNVKEDKVIVDFFDVKAEKIKRVEANQCIMATPQFVNKRIVKGMKEIRDDVFTYAPWMVANITLKKLPEKGGHPLSWDNVLYDSPSLGYIHANHQELKVHKEKRVITYYLALSGKDPVAARKEAIETKHETWKNMIIKDLSLAHRGIEKEIENIDVWLWGHGMIRPVPGFIWHSDREKAQQPIAEKIFFAHSDLSGVSIFEEAFYQGIKAAKGVLTSQEHES